MGNCHKPDQSNVVAPSSLVKASSKRLPLIPQQPGLSLMIRSWKETNNTLFNFHLREEEYEMKIFTINIKKIRIVKIGVEYQALLPEDEEFKKIVPPVMIDIRRLKAVDLYGEKKYEFRLNDFPKISKPFWLVVKTLPTQRYQLKEGDIFKMGKLKLRLKEIIHKNDQVKQIDREIEAEYKVYDFDGRFCNGCVNPEAICRICNDEGTHQNPLINLCECDGTMKYTHYDCLKKWFTIQLNPAKVNQVTEITWKVLQCEYCRKRMPYCVRIDNEMYFLVTFPKIKKPYIVMNPVYKNSNEKSQIYYFVSFKKVNRMVIGRSSDAEIQICTDSTMSRSHSVIEYVGGSDGGGSGNQKGKFYLSDCSSKFGTVVLMKTKKPIEVEVKMNGVEFQVGGDTIKVCYRAKGSYKYMATEGDVDFNANSDEEDDKDINEEEQEADGENQESNAKNGEQKIGGRKKLKPISNTDLQMTQLGRNF